MSKKVLILSGSPRKGGNSDILCDEFLRGAREAGHQVEKVRPAEKKIAPCLGCYYCASHGGECVRRDDMADLLQQMIDADVIVLASPVYYASANATLVAFADRLFYSTRFDKRMKVGASVVVARRGGCSAAFDELNKYFTISGMPVASSRYWNSVHGGIPGEAAQDLEGIATVRELAKNMAFLMKSIALGKEQFGLPEPEPAARTNFIR